MTEYSNFGDKIKQVWRAYKVGLKKARGKLPSENVHQLRTSIVKLIATLRLADGVFSNHDPNKLVVSLKKSRRALGERLEQKGKATLALFNARLAGICPEKIKSVHYFRKAAKQLSYRGRVLQSVLGNSHLDLVNLQTVRAVMGSTQDNSLLLRSTRDYNHKNRAHHPQVKLIRRSRRFL